jgi:hypothetical protein
LLPLKKKIAKIVEFYPPIVQLLLLLPNLIVAWKVKLKNRKMADFKERKLYSVQQKLLESTFLLQYLMEFLVK